MNHINVIIKNKDTINGIDTVKNPYLKIQNQEYMLYEIIHNINLIKKLSTSIIHIVIEYSTYEKKLCIGYNFMYMSSSRSIKRKYVNPCMFIGSNLQQNYTCALRKSVDSTSRTTSNL